MIAAMMFPAMPNVGEDVSSLLFRWIHIVAGVLWIGLLYFFNFVNAELAKTYDADTKKKVVPELMPRALFFFRWGAAWTFITGVLLWALLYLRQPNFSKTGVPERGPALAALGLVVAAFLVYDAIAKALAKKPMAALWVWYLLVLAFVFVLGQTEFFAASNRAVYIHAGAMLGTAMAANVWMRIWPAQRRIITAIKGGTAPDPADVAVAGMRSKHNTFMSVPLLFLMLSVHEAFVGLNFPDPFQPGMLVLGLMVVGYFGTDWLYKKSAKVKGF
ncbi:MAG: urate hydroxylase PuuD [Planctomycetota bacterium]